MYSSSLSTLSAFPGLLSKSCKGVDLTPPPDLRAAAGVEPAPIFFFRKRLPPELHCAECCWVADAAEMLTSVGAPAPCEGPFVSQSVVSGARSLLRDSAEICVCDSCWEAGTDLSRNPPQPPLRFKRIRHDPFLKDQSLSLVTAQLTWVPAGSAFCRRVSGCCLLVEEPFSETCCPRQNHCEAWSPVQTQSVGILMCRGSGAV